MSDSVQPYRRQPTRLPCPWDYPGKNTGVGCHFFLQCMKVKSENEISQSCPTLSDPVDCSLPVSSVQGIFQARALEWGAIAFSTIYVYLNVLCAVVQLLSLPVSPRGQVEKTSFSLSYSLLKPCWFLFISEFHKKVSILLPVYLEPILNRHLSPLVCQRHY